jgi:hypothetical protein
MGQGIAFGSVAPDGIIPACFVMLCLPRILISVSANFDFATIHGDPMGGCSESSEDEESSAFNPSFS